MLIHKGRSRIFQKLRNRLILINLAVTTAVLFLAFSLIYMVARDASLRRPMNLETEYDYTSSVSVIIYKRVQVDRQAALNSLLSSLIMTGIFVEMGVAILSYFLAEIAIRPVRDAYENQKTFIANASHEIKTPLAAISANLEAADIKGNRFIDNVEKEVRAITELNHQLLALTRADNMIKQNISEETVNIKGLVEEVLSAFEPQLKRRHVSTTFSVRLRQEKVVLAKADFLQIITILIDNAVKYCNKKIQITLEPRKFTITNDGAIIKPSDLPHIFDRFYQADKSSEGVGLGLAIAKKLADRENWQLNARSDQETTTFELGFSTGRNPNERCTSDEKA